MQDVMLFMLSEVNCGFYLLELFQLLRLALHGECKHVGIPHSKSLY